MSHSINTPFSCILLRVEIWFQTFVAAVNILAHDSLDSDPHTYQWSEYQRRYTVKTLLNMPYFSSNTGTHRCSHSSAWRFPLQSSSTLATLRSLVFANIHTKFHVTVGRHYWFLVRLSIFSHFLCEIVF
jgi:hypothetical protein